MNIKILIVLLILNSIHVKSQIISPSPEGLNYYSQGIDLMKSEKYKEADSIFTLSLNSFKNENVYFNRGFSRIMLKDTIGFCDDMNFAANRYFDPEAEKYFNKFCCSKVDTVFFNKKRMVTNEPKYRYYEITQVLKYKSLTLGTFHDIKSTSTNMSVDFGMNDELLGAYGKQNNIIAAYLIDKNGKYYYKSTKPTSIINTSLYDKIKKQASINLKAKYGHLIKNKNNEPLRVFFSIHFNKYGRIYKSEYLGLSPKKLQETHLEGMEEFILEIINKYPEVSPAKFFKENVPFIAYDYIEF